MSEVSQPKVFEFAKEIGMETLTLMDKIREWKLPVRSHMAELEPDVLDELRSRLEAESSGKTAAGKKKAAKKKVAKKKVTKKATADGDAKKATTKKTVVVKKAAAKTVLRRKTAEEEEAEAVAAAEPVAEVAAEVPAVKVRPAPAAEPVPEEPAVEVQAAIEVAQQPEAVEDVAESIAAANAPAPVEVAPPPAPAPEPIEAPMEAAPAEEEKRIPTPGRKREVVMTSSGPVSGVKSETPRRNIVGRMDLSRVSPPPHARSGGPGAGPGPGADQGSRPGPRPGPGRSLRTGFVAAAPIEVPQVDEEDRKRFEEKRRRPAGGPSPGPAAGKEKEQEVQQFSATEFRKREMVFQPKKKKGSLNREARKTEITQPKASKRIVKINEAMKVADLAQEMGVKAGQLVKSLMQNGVVATMNTELDFDTISLIVPEFGYEAQNVYRSVDELIESTAFGHLDAELQTRAAIVTVMGHVDHGKTTLLDAIRKSDVASGEAGGITQHIGAYRVTTEHGHTLTFIDTPGHEAFTAMRARGANVTDIAVIVVAADDGVMPQTIEAISHAKAAGVPIIVAVNKVDRPNANVDRIKQQLTEYELVPEEWGGSTIFAPVSALNRTGVTELLEQIYVSAEVLELRANPMRSATGSVIESRMERGRGAVATLLVQDGTLKVGQAIVVGSVAGRVRSLMNERGERVESAGPGVPVEVLGLPETPLAGDKFDVVVDEQSAAKIAEQRKSKAAEATVSAGKMSLEDLFSKLKEGELKELPVVLKTDVAGSVEAIRGMFDKLSTSEVKIKLIHTAVGGISESDVLLASTAKGLIVGFNVRPDSGAQTAAKREGVEIKTYSIVYELMDDMKKALSGLLTPDMVENVLGRAEVRETFTVPKIGTIAGCSVIDGKILRSAQVRLLRDNKIIYTGKITSLKRFKDDAKEVVQGYECGIGIENYNDVKVGDQIEAFEVQSISREL